MPMKERFEALRRAVDEALARYFLPAGDGADGLRQAMSYSALAGGKRIRPVLCLEFCRVCGGNTAPALPVACGVEMLHTYSLIHDDLPCMDDDDLRRGRPTSHLVFGEGTAVLAGDCLQAEAFRSVCAADLPPASRCRCLELLARAAGIDGICGGQFMDLAPGEADADTLSATDLRKTASLMGAACAMGAAAAGAGEELVSAAESFGLALGMAFQCRDDLLDNDGFCRLLGQEKCQALTELYTEKALELLSAFEDTAFLRALTEELSGRAV